MTPTYTDDGGGGSVCTWVEGDEVWCRLESKGEYQQATLRRNSAVKTGCRINISGKIFEILQVADDGDLQVLKCY
ncbi:MAG: head-tail adaptor protein [bacterium]